MSTLRETLTDAMIEAGIPISDKDFIKQYNNAVRDLALMYDTAKARDTQSITCEDNTTEYDLTTGCMKIERVLDENNIPYKRYTVRANSVILFIHTGTFTVYEMFMPTDLTAMTDDVNVDTQYLKPISKYIAAWALKKIDKDRSDELKGEYEVDAAKVNRAIRGTKTGFKTVGVPIFR
jgi:hypothetical protein